MMQLPYLTPDLPGIGGSIKQCPEDFFVQEIPLYEPSGEGEHIYCEIQKKGTTTFDAVNRMADQLQSLDTRTKTVVDVRRETKLINRNPFVLGVSLRDITRPKNDDGDIDLCEA